MFIQLLQLKRNVFLKLVQNYIDITINYQNISQYFRYYLLILHISFEGEKNEA